MCVIYRISTHTLTWSVTRIPQSVLNAAKFQLTRSRGAWLFWRVFTTLMANISTHTLTWSVTSYYVDDYNVEFLFQLTRSRGAWQYKDGSHYCISDFNSHAHVERDMILVSRQQLWSFQLTRSRGAWHRSQISLPLALKFQLTRSRGAWP